MENLRDLIGSVLTAASDGIITGAGYTVTTVTARRHIFVVFRTARPAARKRNRRGVRSGPPVAHSDRSRACAAAATPGHRYCDRKYLREPARPATSAPAREAAAAPRARRATRHTRLCSGRPGSCWDRAVFGRAAQAATRRTDTRLGPDRGLARSAPPPVVATRLGRGPAIPSG